MPATLSEIRIRLEQATALRDDAAETVSSLALGGAATNAETHSARTKHVAKLQGYQREVKLLHKIETDLISQGRAAENDLAVLSGFDAPPPASAVSTPSAASDAPMPPREAPRNEASAAPLSAAGDVF